MTRSLTLNDLTVHLPDDQQLAIVADWRWLIGPERHPLLVTAMGHAFLHDMTDGAITLLDTEAGQLLPIADDVDGFRDLLRDEAFVRERFAVDAVSGLMDAGCRLAEGEVYGAVPATSPEDGAGSVAFAPLALATHFARTGQVHAHAHAHARTSAADADAGGA